MLRRKGLKGQVPCQKGAQQYADEPERKEIIYLSLRILVLFDLLLRKCVCRAC